MKGKKRWFIAGAAALVAALEVAGPQPASRVLAAAIRLLVLPRDAGYPVPAEQLPDPGKSGL